MPPPGGEPSEAARRKIAEILIKRGRSELHVAAAFAQITRELIDVGADEVVLRLAADAVADEVRHAGLWFGVAARFAGAPVPWQSAGAARLPTHPGAEPWLVPALHVVGLCCINETIASVRLRGCLEHTTDPEVRATLREILSDEIDHARLGWAFLASKSVDERTRAALATWLPRLLGANIDALFQDVEGKLDEGFFDQGIPSAARTRAIVASALEDVVLPGFASVGIATRPAREWMATSFGR